jgi:hypothetical protein
MPVTDYLSVATLGWADSAGGGSGVDAPSIGTIGWMEESTSTAPAVIARKGVGIHMDRYTHRHIRRP